MKIREVTSDPNANPCPACSDEPRVSESSAAYAGPEMEASTLRLVETENAGLRRLIVDLIHENQQLRQKINPAGDEDPLRSAIAS
jgi:hypothetical protein